MTTGNREAKERTKVKTGMPMIVKTMTLSDIKNMYDNKACMKVLSSINLMTVNSVDSILTEDIVKITSINEDKIKELIRDDNRVLIYKHNDSNKPNTVRALEIISEVNSGIYKCNLVKFKYGYSKEYGRMVEFVAD